MALAVQPYIFGPGILWGIQLNDSNGLAIVNPTPARLGELQDMQIDFDSSLSELYGAYQMPLAVGRKPSKVTVKAKFARWDASALNFLYFGEPSMPVTGGATQVTIAHDEGPTLIPTTPFNITVVNATGGIVDLGVRFGSAAGALAGTRLTNVASAPTTGQYSYVAATGVYTFAAADNVSGYNVLIDYSYSTTGSTFKTIQIANHLLGAAPQFIVYGKATYGATTQKIGFRFNQCVASKLSLPTKLDNFTIGDFEFGCFADGGLQIGAITLPYL
jgi:hypothetical protein